MFDGLLDQLMVLVSEDMLNLLAGLAILVVGWIVARIVKTCCLSLMKRTNMTTAWPAR